MSVPRTGHAQATRRASVPRLGGGGAARTCPRRAPARTRTRTPRADASTPASDAGGEGSSGGTADVVRVEGVSSDWLDDGLSDTEAGEGSWSGAAAPRADRSRKESAAAAAKAAARDSVEAVKRWAQGARPPQPGDVERLRRELARGVRKPAALATLGGAAVVFALAAVAASKRSAAEAEARAAARAAAAAEIAPDTAEADTADVAGDAREANDGVGPSEGVDLEVRASPGATPEAQAPAEGGAAAALATPTMQRHAPYYTLGERHHAAHRSDTASGGDTFGLGGADVRPQALRADATPLERLQHYGIADQEALPYEVITRRKFARWLRDAAGDVQIQGNAPASAQRRVSPVDTGELPVFLDVGAGDPDFAVVQSLADAGVIPSQYSGGGSLFRPDAPLTREALIAWKLALDQRTLPPATAADVAWLWGFSDANAIADAALSAVAADRGLGQASTIAATFGWTKLLHPKRAVTCEQAARALVVWSDPGVDPMPAAAAAGAGMGAGGAPAAADTARAGATMGTPEAVVRTGVPVSRVAAPEESPQAAARAVEAVLQEEQDASQQQGESAEDVAKEGPAEADEEPSETDPPAPADVPAPVATQQSTSVLSQPSSHQPQSSTESQPQPQPPRTAQEPTAQPAGANAITAQPATGSDDGVPPLQSAAVFVGTAAGRILGMTAHSVQWLAGTVNEQLIASGRLEAWGRAACTAAKDASALIGAKAVEAGKVIAVAAAPVLHQTKERAGQLASAASDSLRAAYVRFQEAAVQARAEAGDKASAEAKVASAKAGPDASSGGDDDKRDNSDGGDAASTGSPPTEGEDAPPSDAPAAPSA